MKTLKDIAYKYADLASIYMVNGQYFKRAYITGNLQSRVKNYNDLSKMLKEESEGRIVLALNYAPPDAEYGFFVHEGKGSSTKYGPRRYSEYAANDPELQSYINEFILGQMDKKVEELVKPLDFVLKGFAKK
jgi:hypothetical protein